MIAWSRLRAYEEGVAAKIDLQVADTLALPFVADCFDAVICESVLGFVDDKRQASAACVRVTKPGGYVGLNETLWVKECTDDKPIDCRIHTSACTGRGDSRRRGAPSGP